MLLLNHLLFISKYWLFVSVMLLLCVVCLLCLISLFFRISCNAINVANVVILDVKHYFRFHVFFRFKVMQFM